MLTTLRRLALAALLSLGLSPALAAVPPPVPALPDSPRLTSYSISTSTCACNVNFAIYGLTSSGSYWEWIEVFVNGVRVNYNDPTFGWAITSPTGPIASIPQPITDAVLTFTNPQTGVIQIVGAQVPARLTQFQENAGVPARNLNVAFTSIIAGMREIWDKINDVTGRGLFFAPGNTTGPMPPPPSCAGQFLAFDSTGLNPICVTPLAGSGAITPGVLGNPGPGNALPASLTTLPSVVQNAPGLATSTPASAAALNEDIAAAITAGQSGIALTPGVYALVKSGTGADGVATAGLINAPPGDFTLDGQGSTLSLTGSDVSSYANLLTVQNATAGKVTIKNLDIVYASPPFAQATLSSTVACVANANGSATFAMQAGYAPAWASVLRIDQYSATTGLFVINVYSSTSSSMALNNLGSGNYSVAFNGTTQCNALATMSTTQTYVLDSTQFGFYGINAYHVYDLVFDNVRVFNTAGNGFQVTGAHDVRYINNSGVYKAPGAYRSVNGAGAAHVYMSGALITDPTVHFKGSGDDSFFAAPYQVNITTASSRTSLVLTGTPYILAGDVLQFVDTNGVLQGTATVTAITAGSGPTVTLAGTGAPSGVANTWLIYDQSQAASLAQINGGDFGDSPTRALFVDALRIEFNAPHAYNTGSGGILVSYGNQNVGLVPTTVTINAPVVVNNNYANDASDGSIAVEGWNIAGNAAATAGQIATVVVENPNCQQAGSSCLYISAANNVTSSFGSWFNWYQLVTAPALTQGCGTTMYQEAVAFCNVTNAIYTSGFFLSGGGQETSFGSSVINPPIPASSIVGQVPVANGGTSLATLTANSVLLGEGTSALHFATIGTAGRALLDQGAAVDPAFKAISGDATLASAGGLTLATVNTNVGTFGSATQVAQVTLNGKGLTTAAVALTITPAVGSITGLGTGVATALGVNTGSSGAFVVQNGAGGTPTSLTLTNATGLPPAGLTVDTISGIVLGNNLATLTFGTHLITGGSSYNGSASVTITSDATNANTASTIVARDASGNFTAGTITAALTGHASSDCALAGCTMAGNIAMGGFSVTGAATISANQIAMLVGSTNFFTASATSGQLMIQTTTSGAVTNNALLIDSTQNSTFYGHVIGSNSAAAASISACGGGSPAVTGGDNFGKITAGTGALGSCVINFGKTWGAAPACAVSSPTSLTALTVTSSTTQLTIGATSLTSDVLNYVCGSTAWLEPANDNQPLRKAA